MDRNEYIIEKPTFPAGFPKEKQDAWHKTYAEALEEAKSESPESTLHHQKARTEANRHMRVPTPKSYQEAKRMEKWMVLKSEERDGELKVVTIDGKKHIFEIPASRGRAAEAGEGAADGKSPQGGAQSGTGAPATK